MAEGQGETAKGKTEVVELTKLQETVVRRVSESKATVPHLYLSVEVDMSRVVDARERGRTAAAEGEVVPSINDMIVKAVATALREHRRANGAYRDGKFELYSRVNIGITVAAEDSRLVPIVFDADVKDLGQIAAESRALAEKARAGAITQPELSGGTFTIANLSKYGIDDLAAVITPPQAGILGIGAIVERPVVREGEITTGHLMAMTLASDHRILYGREAAEFLARIRALLEDPAGMGL